MFSVDSFLLLTRIIAKQEEDEIIRREIGILKASLSSPDALSGGKKLKEWLIRLIYCDMLGHDVSFGYIVAINATQMVNLEFVVCFFFCFFFWHDIIYFLFRAQVLINELASLHVPC